MNYDRSGELLELLSSHLTSKRSLLRRPYKQPLNGKHLYFPVLFNFHS
ncbi:MAG: hypothetical protein O4861_24405 [Trichodesmium sp. St16_bin4-tuft]|nr:hypothetical protein [Trichodesmium sp. MAG_R01]MDE5067913.1 hypothetical protein [Trichodesmium sp. St4_bin8_1]MDE5071548.1 hypothetical protein [Trichodesmium sp. St5_bin8]MDE5077725.1 hypothetical protein [Trichodesmium sp. St2_bin6]MDE5090697.1 hypothetical protein [Trichodesmium sp. St18_bin3_1_1]MDE5101297.1 hypothetical protein [Trichodesmium sp. St16_bin4-tuft]